MERLNYYLSIGALCVVIGIIIEKYTLGFDFISTIFFGIGVGLLVTGLYVKKHGDDEIKALKSKWLKRKM